MGDQDDEYFVGHLPMPKRLGQFYFALIALLLVLGIGFSFWTASAQKSTGEGHWDLSKTQTLSGYLSIDPYPVLHTTGENSRSIMLLRQGKHSALDFVQPLANEHVSVTGFPIGRGDWLALELRTSDDVSLTPPPVGADRPNKTTLNNVTLNGEVVDSKCYLGVMKPGGGKVHRACAALCVKGGIPPMLVVTQNDGSRFGYVLVDHQGETAREEVLPTIAVPVSVSGQLERRGDLTYLRIAAEGVQRI